MAKSNGITDNARCGFVCEQMSDVTPVADKTMPAPKLTDGEKHMQQYIQIYL